MLADQHKKSLMRFSGRSGQFRIGIILLAAVVLGVVGVLNLHTASEIGGKVDMSLTDLFSNWTSDIDPRKQYTFSGTQLVAIACFQTGIVQLAMALLLALFVWSNWAIKRRDEAIVALLKKHGEIPN
jgi:hypothetical protein